MLEADGERRWRFGKSLGMGPRLENGVRGQRHKPVRPALGGNFAIEDVGLVTAGNDEVRTFVGGQRLLFHPPVAAKEVGDEVPIMMRFQGPRGAGATE